MIKAAIMGFGTIGSGVAEVLDINKKSIAARVGDEVELKYVLDLRDFELICSVLPRSVRKVYLH